MARLYAEQPDQFARITVALRVPEELEVQDQWFAASGAKRSGGTPPGGVDEEQSARSPTVTAT